jgi:hypothetical protein
MYKSVSRAMLFWLCSIDAGWENSKVPAAARPATHNLRTRSNAAALTGERFATYKNVPLMDLAFTTIFSAVPRAFQRQAVGARLPRHLITTSVRRVRERRTSCWWRSLRLQGRSASGADPSRPAHAAREPDEDIDESFSPDIGDSGESPNSLDVTRVSAALYRLGAVAWWAQLLLSIVAGGITLFAVAILQGTRGAGTTTTTAASTGLIFAGIGLVFAFISVFWAYGYIRLARRLMRAGKMGYGIRSENIFRTLRIGVFINILGMALTLIGAQSISGVLLAKALSQGVAGPLPFYATGSIQAGGGTVGYVQALDIFVVQANTNALLSHFVGLCVALWMLWRFRGSHQRRTS